MAIRAQINSEPFGRPPSPKPPPGVPPSLLRLRWRNSSSEVTGAPLLLRPRLGGSPHGPPDGSSSCGGSLPPPAPGGEPHGPLLSLKRARPRAPHPEKIVMSPIIGGLRPKNSAARRKDGLRP